MENINTQIKSIAIMIPEYTVSQISYRLKSVVENEFSYVKIRGEVSGFKLAPSGHAYFSLKDDNALISAVCWKNVFGNLAVKPQEGIELLCVGTITTYPGQSKYQLVVEKIEIAGIGALMAMLEKRKAQFAKEGLFNPEHKKKIPFLPQKIGIITSPTGAVIRDILHRIEDRFPTHIMLWPVLVQGDKASEQITEAIKGFNTLKDKPDIIIVARGGGSVEDLWAFNEENIIRAAFASSIPIISAVGHETDFTLLDFVADLRAPTPTAAAEMSVPVLSNVAATIRSISNRGEFALNKYFENKKNRLLMLQKSMPNYQTILINFIQRVDDISIRLLNAQKRFFEISLNKVVNLSLRIKHPKDIVNFNEQKLLRLSKLLEKVKDISHNENKVKLNLLSSLLNSYSYKKTLQRGFAIIIDQNNTPIMATEQVQKGDKLIAELQDGKLSLTVN